MSATDPAPTGERPDGDPAPAQRSAKRSPWRWATAGVAVVAIALGVWGLNERSNATEAKADLQAESAPSAAPATTTEATTQAQQPTGTSTPPPATQTTE